ncbi:MAG TPA: SET domain-containing protein-lysine N-methyltransferase [Chthoniobacterales bacterium]|nr:SET domain-containing protein-lysine N-methyltransferase [Chthoniobacterales bacterium]
MHLRVHTLFIGSALLALTATAQEKPVKPTENVDTLTAKNIQAKGGNDSRWINHSCDPNCETTEIEDRIFVCPLRSIQVGEELFYDYRIVPAKRRTKALEKKFACGCGSANCRGTMLEPK